MMTQPLPMKNATGLVPNAHDIPFRSLEVAVCLVLAPLLAPLWLAHFALARLQGHAWLEREKILGRDGRELVIRRAVALQRGWYRRLFNSRIIAGSPLLVSVLKGDLSLVGPRPVAAEWLAVNPERYHERLLVRPGLIHTHMIRSRVNIAFEEERELALVDARNHGFCKRLGRLLKVIPALLLGSDREGRRPPDSFTLFSLTFANRSRAEAVAEILALAETGQRRRVAFVNPACVNIAMKDAAYLEILRRSDLIYPDGIGIQLACKLTGRPMRENLNGTDLFPALAAALERTGQGLYLLGAREQVVTAMATKLAQQWPALKLCGYHHGYFDEAQEPDLIAEINDSGADVLLVARGVPGQELLIDRMLPGLRVGVAMGVGGLFDFYSGAMPRAPLWMRETGLEWCYRLIREPTRLWRRYLLGNLIFLWHLARWRK